MSLSWRCPKELPRTQPGASEPHAAFGVFRQALVLALLAAGLHGLATNEAQERKNAPGGNLPFA